MTGAKRLIFTVVSLVIVAAAVAGIAFASTSINLNSQKPGLVVDGTTVSDPGTIVTIGDNEVGFEEYRYEYLMTKEYFESMYGEDIWDQDYDGGYAFQIKTGALESFQNSFAWVKIANDNGVELSKENKEAVQDEYTELLSSYNGDEEAALGSAHFITKDTYFTVVERQKLVLQAKEEYKAKITAEKEDEILKNDVVSAKHILIQIDSAATDSAAAKVAAREKAEELLTQIRERKDTEKTFNDLMNEYSEDTGLETYPDGYTFGLGTMLDAFYDGAAALKIGEVSDLVETDYGYHIIMRLPLDEDYVKKNKEDILNNSVSAIMNDEVGAIIETMTVAPGEYYDSIAPGTIR